MVCWLFPDGDFCAELEALVRARHQPELATAVQHAARLSPEYAAALRRNGYSLESGQVVASASTAELQDDIRDAARGAGPLLLTGETGTGKSAMAEAIRKASGRPSVVVVDCPNLTGEMALTTLFGCTRGSFTGATERPGLLEQADGQVLFFDEIGDMPLECQRRLLLFLENRVVQRVGATDSKTIDVLIVAATHKDLVEEIAAGRFRQDLYHRLEGACFELPPFRERPAKERAALLDHFLAGAPMAEETRAQVLAHPWPGNIRQLKQFVENARPRLREGRSVRLPSARAIALKETVDSTQCLARIAESLERVGHLVTDGWSPRRRQVEDLKRLETYRKWAAEIGEAITACNGVLRRAAEVLNLGWTTFYKRYRRVMTLGLVTPVTRRHRRPAC